MKIRILPVVALCLFLGSAGMAQEPGNLRLDRNDFFREILTSKSTPRTAYYDANFEGSYQVSKNDVIRGLPDAAKSQGADLRGVYLFGPYGPMRIVIVYVFTGEKGSIRINQIKMVQGRLISKSTGLMTLAKYENFWNGVLKTNVLSSGMAADGEADKANETLLARWTEEKVETYYGSVISPKPGANVTEFSKTTEVLVRSLKSTSRPSAPSQPETKER